MRLQYFSLSKSQTAGMRLQYCSLSKSQTAGGFVMNFPQNTDDTTPIGQKGRGTPEHLYWKKNNVCLTNFFAYFVPCKFWSELDQTRTSKTPIYEGVHLSKKSVLLVNSFHKCYADGKRYEFQKVSLAQKSYIVE